MKKLLLLIVLLCPLIGWTICSNSICVSIPGSTPVIPLCEPGTFSFLVENNSGTNITNFDLRINTITQVSIVSVSAVDGNSIPITLGSITNNAPNWIIDGLGYNFLNGSTMTVTVQVQVDCALTSLPGAQGQNTALIDIAILNSGGTPVSQFNGANNALLIIYEALIISPQPYTFAGPMVPPAPPIGYHYMWRRVIVNNAYRNFVFSPTGNPLRGFRMETSFGQNTYVKDIYTSGGALVSASINTQVPSLTGRILFDGLDYQQLSGGTSNTWPLGTTIEYWELVVVANCNTAYQTTTRVGWNCSNGATLTFTSALCFASQPLSLGTIPANGANPSVAAPVFSIVGPSDLCYGPANQSTYRYTITNTGAGVATNYVIHFEDNQTVPFDVSSTTYFGYVLNPMNAGDIVDGVNHTITIANIAPGATYTITWQARHDCPAAILCPKAVYLDDWRRSISYGGFCDGHVYTQPFANNGTTDVRAVEKGGGLVPIGPGVYALTGNTANVYTAPEGVAEFGLSLSNLAQLNAATWPGNGLHQSIVMHLKIGPDMNLYQYSLVDNAHLATSVRVYAGTFQIPANALNVAYNAGFASNSAEDEIIIRIDVDDPDLTAFFALHGLPNSLFGLMDNLFLVADLIPYCRPSNASNYCDLTVFHIPNNTCATQCEIPLFCSTGNEVKINCPGCLNQGVFTDDFLLWRTTYGSVDATNDGRADVSGSITPPVNDPSELPMGVAERRVMYKDKFLTSFRGHMELNGNYFPNNIASPPFDYINGQYGIRRWYLRVEFGAHGTTGSGCWDDVLPVPNGIKVWLDGELAVLNYNLADGDFYDANSHEYCFRLDCVRLQAANGNMPDLLTNLMDIRVDCEFELINNIGYNVSNIECPVNAYCYASLRDEIADPTTWLVDLDDCLVSQIQFLTDMCSASPPSSPSCSDFYPNVPNNNLIIDACDDMRWGCINGTNNASFDEVGFDFAMMDFVMPNNGTWTKIGACKWSMYNTINSIDYPYAPVRSFRMANEDIPYSLIFPYEFRNWVQLEELSYTVNPPFPPGSNPRFTLERYSQFVTPYSQFTDTEREDSDFLNNNLNQHFYNALTNYLPPPGYPAVPGDPNGNPIDIIPNNLYTDGLALTSTTHPFLLPDDSHFNNGLVTVQFDCPPSPISSGQFYELTLNEQDRFSNGIGDQAYTSGTQANVGGNTWEDHKTIVMNSFNQSPVPEPHITVTPQYGQGNEGHLCWEIDIKNDIPGNNYYPGSPVPYTWFGVQLDPGYTQWGNVSFTLTSSGGDWLDNDANINQVLATNDFVYFLNPYAAAPKTSLSRGEHFTLHICVDYNCLTPPDRLTNPVNFTFWMVMHTAA